MADWRGASWTGILEYLTDNYQIDRPAASLLMNRHREIVSYCISQNDTNDFVGENIARLGRLTLRPEFPDDEESNE